MRNSRNHGDGDGPQRIPSYGHQYDKLHAAVLSDDSPDEAFQSRISNKDKVAYIAEALRLHPDHFHLDLPLPLDDWQLSDDLSLISAGLYFSYLRTLFFARLLDENPELTTTEAWSNHAAAEYWNRAFNREYGKRVHGILLPDSRAVH
ncbi:hypothetical protein PAPPERLAPAPP_04900 [Brevundimonas phage vB_BpoS-Papperlapapp]|uniref:Uncharacterized protein n=1 Tax=Brevundimonas phage vB_BpoS-Domovoi TaxID=2948598 RepID=A0A9E7SKT8_9CAUD|nr:hypothetical protein DOMOVOI_03850 [Brevundimonas phage vB_BpoS-Domovoi]USN16231.1 hypothetical protein PAPPERLAPAPP_04900 [Brevundimonas phage vB_BpoS-Papperlapapp]